jgi:hypothetical protein
MLYQLLLLQVSAHLIADFNFQSQKWSDGKSKKPITKYHLYHIIVVFVLAYVLSFDYNFWPAALSISFLHLVTDIVKSYLHRKTTNRTRKNMYFFVDQVIHVGIIVTISILYHWLFEIDFLFDLNIKIVATLAGFIFCSKPSNILIKRILIAFSIELPEEKNEKPEDSSDEKSLPNAGKLIGITERFLTLALIIVGQYGAVGLVIAAKSILRYNSTQKSEYILVGTLLSFSLATLTGILIRQL